MAPGSEGTNLPGLDTDIGFSNMEVTGDLDTIADKMGIALRLKEWSTEPSMSHREGRISLGTRT